MTEHHERPERSPDVSVEHHGTIVLVRPISRDAHIWIRDNVEYEGWQMFGGALAVEPRTVDVLVDGMRLDGLEVH